MGDCHLLLSLVFISFISLSSLCALFISNPSHLLLLPEKMKIQCDVCNREEASVFCSADEAVLCDGCDGRVHHANKLASKHPRFSLLHPSYKQSPLCDICKVISLQTKPTKQISLKVISSLSFSQSSKKEKKNDLGFVGKACYCLLSRGPCDSL